jgi:hypothetical protein
MPSASSQPLSHRMVKPSAPDLSLQDPWHRRELVGLGVSWSA